ncbi:MAG: carbamate kinase [Myxococcota bacterium]
MTTHSNEDVLPTPPTAIVAMGGHAFIKPGERGTYDDHTKNAREICQAMMVLIERGYRLVITHGNGPQVGDLMTRTEMSSSEVPRLPLDVLVAQTQGSLGYYLQRALINEMHARGLRRRFVTTMVTQVMVSPEDPAFDSPTKPVGPFMTQEAAERKQSKYGWNIVKDLNRGWRRVVPSPKPEKIVQADMIREAVRSGNIVVAAGGGGIPVSLSPESGEYTGIEAVIDKDLTSSVLATDVDAELLVILTAVDGVYLNFGEDDERQLGAVTMAECRRHIDAGHFPAGSMGPKVEAVYGFLRRGGRRGLITSAAKLRDALDGQAGTHFIGKI